MWFLRRPVPMSPSETASASVVLFRVYDVAHATYRLDEFDFEVIVYFCSQPTYRDLDHVGIAVEIHVPDIRGNLGAAHHLALLARKQLQQRELAVGQLYALACTADLAARHIDFQLRERQQIVFPWRSSARQCADPREQLDKRKRLDQIVIGAEFEPTYAIDYVVTGRSEEHT